MRMIWDLGFGIADLTNGKGRAFEARGDNLRVPVSPFTSSLHNFFTLHSSLDYSITWLLDHFPEVPPCRA